MGPNEPRGLRVLTYNVGLLDLTLAGVRIDEVPFRGERLLEIVALLRRSGADLICLQEVFRADHASGIIEELAAEYPFSARHDNRRLIGLGHGLLCLSKFPISSSRFVTFKAGLRHERLIIRRGFLDLRVQEALPGGRELAVANLHTTAGGRIGTEAPVTNEIRSRQLDEVHHAVGRDENAALVCGDFNAGPEASAVNYDHFLELGWTDVVADTLGPELLKPTWRPDNPLVAGSGFESSPPQRIDHVFANAALLQTLEVRSAEFTFGEATVVAGELSLTPSDHLGVSVNLAAR